MTADKRAAHKKSKLFYGVGINDADYAVTLSARIDGKQKQLWICPLFLAWRDMLQRSYSVKFHLKNPTYVGCSVVAEWHKFSVFRAWMAGQDWEGKQLDKDILQPGNKIYSPDTCVFVPHALNSFMGDSAAARGEWPIGVSLDKHSGKLHARCRNPFTGKKEHIGRFTDPVIAHEAWRKRKHELACIYAEQQVDPRIAEALRLRYKEK